MHQERLGGPGEISIMETGGYERPVKERHRIQSQGLDLAGIEDVGTGIGDAERLEKLRSRRHHR